MSRFLLFLWSILCLQKSNALSVVIGISCLNGPKSKVVLIFDKHESSPTHVSQKTNLHKNELTTLIESLKKRTHKTTFHIEWPYNAKHFSKTLDFATIHVGARDALTNMQNGTLTYKSFDERIEADFWIREMVIKAQAIAQALHNKQQLPKEFNQLTIESYLRLVQERQAIAKEKISALPLEVAKIMTGRIDTYEKTLTLITSLMEKAKLQAAEHFFKLIEIAALISKDTLILLLMATLEVAAIHIELCLLNSVLADQNQSILSVIHAGAYHASNLEKVLLSLNFVDAFPDRELKNNLQADNLSSIQLPTTIPSSFIRHINEFLSLCNSCGKATSIKCSICKHAYYCSAGCQKEDWQNHKNICKK